MSTGFRTTALPTPRSVLATLQIEWRPPPLAIVRERLFSTAGPKTFCYPRHAPFGNGERRSRNNNSAVRTFVPVPLTTVQFSLVNFRRASRGSSLSHRDDVGHNAPGRKLDRSGGTALLHQIAQDGRNRSGANVRKCNRRTASGASPHHFWRSPHAIPAAPP